MLSKEEAIECFRDPFWMPNGPAKEARLAQLREEAIAVRKKINGPIVEAFKAGASIRQLAVKFNTTASKIEEKLRKRLL